MNISGSPVIHARRWLIGPVGDKKMNSMPTMTTTDIKFGAYKKSCTFFFTDALRIWFSISASRIGTGKLHKRPNKLNLSVFIKMTSKFGEDRNFSKCFHPTHSLPIIPLIGLKSLNAMTAPYIGTYLKIRVSTSAGASRR